MRYNITSINRREAVLRFAFLGSIVAILLTLSAIFILPKLTRPVSAVTPPDSCFDFDAATGTINQYYDNQLNDSSNPACPKDVDIPSSIGGVTVTRIGSDNWWQEAFRGKSITSVTIPSTVTEISSGAFSSNQLTSVIIPSSVADIDYGAFQSNDIVNLVIPDSVTSIGGSCLFG